MVVDAYRVVAVVFEVVKDRAVIAQRKVLIRQTRMEFAPRYRVIVHMLRDFWL